jgi:hypothetical protein
MANLEVVTTSKSANDSVLQHRPFGAIGRGSRSTLRSRASDCASLQTKIFQNLAIAASGETRLHLHRAATLMEHAVAVAWSEHPELARVEIAGDFPRGCELVSDLALVAQAKSGSEQLESAGELHLAVADKKHFGAALPNVMGTVRRVCRNVKRWRSASMARRWIAAAMQEAAKGFRRPKAHNTSPPLRSRASPWHRQNAEVPKRPRAIVCASTAHRL